MKGYRNNKNLYTIEVYKAQSYVTDKYRNLIPSLKNKTEEHVTSSLGSEFHSLTESTKK